MFVNCVKFYMNWSAYVLGLIDQQYNDEDIVVLADNPYITQEYVKAVRATTANRKIYPFTPKGPYKPKSATLLKIDAYVKEKGVKPFLKELRKQGSIEIGEKLGVPPMQVRNYVNRCIRTRKGITPYRQKYLTYESKLIAEGKKEKPPEKITLESMKDLW